MRNRLPFLLCLATVAWAAGDRPDPFEIEFFSLSPSIVVGIRPDPLRSPVAGNVGVIFNEEDVVVIDAGASPKVAEQVLNLIRGRTGKPVTTLVLTHGHEDHVLGAQVFSEAFPALRIVAREGTRNYLSAEGPVAGRVASFPERAAELQSEGKSEIDALEHSGADPALILHRRRYFERDLPFVTAERRRTRVVAPDFVIENRTVLHRSRRRIEILNLGPGKAGSDLIIHLPDDGIVFAGDVITHPVPYGFARLPTGWLDTLRNLRKLEFQTLVPGHGKVLQGRDYLDQVMALVADELEAVSQAAASGLTEEQTVKRVDLSAWRRIFAQGDPVVAYYFDLWFGQPALSRAYREKKGAQE